MGTSGVSAISSADEFQALEAKVMRAVEILKRERESRASAEAEVARLRERVEEQARAIEGLEQDRETQATAAEAAQSELAVLQDERTEVRQRIERMLHQMDELL